MKSLFALFFVTLFACGMQAQESKSPSLVQTPKDPGKAFALSMLIPGAGQMHNDQVGLGLGIFISEAIVIGAGTYLRYDDIVRNQGDISNTRWTAMFFTAGAIHLVQAIHAPIVSARINKSNGYGAQRGLMGYVHPTPNGAGFTLVF